MSEDQDIIELPESLHDLGQGERDSDPEIARKRAEGVTGEGIPSRTDMPDFTSGPGYTGQIPPEGSEGNEADWNASGDVGRESGE